MEKHFNDFRTKAIFKVGSLDLIPKGRSASQIGLYTFIRSSETPIKLGVDGVPTLLQSHEILSLTPIQHIEMFEGTDAIVYQFNREFYCIKDHDETVGCAGLLFFGNEQRPIVSLNSKDQRSYTILHEVFLEEMETKDHIQAEMLQLLMSRFIIKTTRLLSANKEILKNPDLKSDTYRQFNMLVETHFKEAHNVAFYADLLNKSPKTLSNSFSSYGKSPLRIIHDRLILEAKRQLQYTDKTVKEIAFDIGFEEASHLSRLFKKMTGDTLTDYKTSPTRIS